MPKWKTARKFGKEKFTHYTAVAGGKASKPKAQHIAKALRAKGQKARVTPYKYGFVVWRKKA